MLKKFSAKAKIGVMIGILQLPTFSQALTWEDLWLNPNQQGADLLKHNKNQEAAAKFTDTKWKGIAYYQDKQYERAYEQFKSDHSALGFYNQGNSLAYMHKYQEAINAYQEALKLDKNYPDAKYNIEVLEKLLKDQTKNNSQNSSQAKNNQAKNDQSKADNKSADNSNNHSGTNNSKQDNTQNKQTNQASNNNSSSDNSKNPANQYNPQDYSKNNQANGHKEQKLNNEPAAGKENSQQKDNLPGQINKRDGAQNSTNQAAIANSQASKEQLKQQEIQAKLSQVPDDPGGLLRNKFLRDYQRQQQEGNNE